VRGCRCDLRFFLHPILPLSSTFSLGWDIPWFYQKESSVPTAKTLLPRINKARSWQRALFCAFQHMLYSYPVPLFSGITNTQ
jgi:hypothetical protein